MKDGICCPVVLILGQLHDPSHPCDLQPTGGTFTTAFRFLSQSDYRNNPFRKSGWNSDVPGGSTVVGPCASVNGCTVGGTTSDVLRYPAASVRRPNAGHLTPPPSHDAQLVHTAPCIAPWCIPRPLSSHLLTTKYATSFMLVRNRL